MRFDGRSAVEDSSGDATLCKMMPFYRDHDRTVLTESSDETQRPGTTEQDVQQRQHLDEQSSSAVPSYMRELAAARLTRHSRASSMISTATKLSTTTFGEDARSIDLVVGGQYFRIARDGSRITDAAPPPYGLSPDLQGASTLTPPLREDSPSISEISETSSVSSRALRNARYIITSDDESEGELDEGGTVTPRQHSPVRDLESGLRANILESARLDTPSHVESNNTGPWTPVAIRNGDLPTRNASYEEGSEELSMAPEARRLRRTESQLGLRAAGAPQMTSHLRGRSGELLTLDTQLPRFGSAAESQQHKPSSGKSRSAGPVLYGPHNQDEPRSPDFIGRRAHGVFPRPGPVQRSLTTVPPGSDKDLAESPHHSPRPLPMDNENDISLHYAGIMRRLDQDHRKELLFREREVAHLRQRLVEMDTVYRQELRARDFIIDDLRARLQHTEEQTETRIEKARNSIEDVWEARWKAQSFHLWERMRRIEEESQATIDRILAERSPAKRRPADSTDDDDDEDTL